MINIQQLKTGIYRIRSTEGPESLLSKYNMIKTSFENDNDKHTIQKTPYIFENNKLTFSTDNYQLEFNINCGNGFKIDVPLTTNERFFGLGDETRNCFMKRGHKALIRVENVHSYGPIPYIMSSAGWSVLVNCTYRHTFDIGNSNSDLLTIEADKGTLDFFVFLGSDMRDALRLYTEVSGRPVMLPKGAYGLTFVTNEDTTAYSLLTDCRTFKDLNIPCDIMGLEPSWMSKSYDDSTEKKWDHNRFYMPIWQPDNYYGSWSFIYNIHKMGYMLSLWLCTTYDIFWKEENDSLKSENFSMGEGEIKDLHFTSGIRMDNVTKDGEPWFEHLKKFVDNGAEAFKLDGSSQIIPFPDRLWAGKYLDEEVHNIYPLVYAKQMKEGYEEYTGKRAMINTCGNYAGMQKYAATWAGDTGCGTDVLISLMSFSMCGHSNASCDMSPDDIQKLHFGFLLPWSQHLGWANYLYPWFLDDDTLETYRFYSQLRSSLFPYIYSYSHYAYETGLAILRPLPLIYLDTDKYDDINNEYMFGESLLVVVYDMKVTLPDGDDWYDFWTGDFYKGGQTFDYTPPKNRGGALFVKSGSVFAMQDWSHSLRDFKPSKYYIHVYTGKDAEFTLYEDDGKSYAYMDGDFAKTNISFISDTLTIGSRTGSYDGMTDITDFEVILHTPNGNVKNYVASPNKPLYLDLSQQI